MHHDKLIKASLFFPFINANFKKKIDFIENYINKIIFFASA